MTMPVYPIRDARLHHAVAAFRGQGGYGVVAAARKRSVGDFVPPPACTGLERETGRRRRHGSTSRQSG